MMAYRCFFGIVGSSLVSARPVDMGLKTVFESY